MSFITYLKESIAEYGNGGDGSFEYVGINIINNSIANTKTYRRPVQRNKDLDIGYSAINTEIFNKFKKINSEITVCDFSKSYFRSIESERVVFAIPQNISIHNESEIVSAFFNSLTLDSVKKKLFDDLEIVKKHIRMNYSPLMQLGTECDALGNCLSVKYYISIQNCIGKNNGYGLKQQSVVSKICPNDKRSLLDERIKIMCNNDFCPIFIGTNSNGSYSENKLYFIHNYMNRGYDLLSAMEKLIFDLGIEKAITIEDVKKVINLGLYVEGIALSFNDSDLIRLYFNYIPKNICIDKFL